MKLAHTIFSFRNRLVIIIVGISLGAVSLLYTNNMARRLKEKEQHDVVLWAHAMERINRDVLGGAPMQDPLVSDIMSTGNNIPFIITDENLKVLHSHLIPDEIINHPGKLRREIDKLTEENTPIPVKILWSAKHYHIIFYGRSALLKSLYYFPYIQILVFAAFISLGFIAFRSSKHDEQNRVWIGLAKETAHQLGTPTSSLLGWIEYLRSQPVDQSAVEEMQKDLTHLMKIVDRFSKIGSETPLTPANINEVVGESVMYFRKRIPRNVTLRLQRTGHRPGAGEHQRRAVRMGGGEPDEELARRPAGPRSNRCPHLVGRTARDDRRQGYGQGNPQEQLETHLRAGLHDQDPRLGPRVVALAADRRGVPPG